MHGNTLLASAATIAVAAALPQIVTTVTEPTTTTYHPGYSFGFPGFSGYNSGYRGYGGNNYLNGFGYNSYNPYNPYSSTVGSASLGFLPGALGSSTSIDGYTGYQAPYVYSFPGDYKRTQGDAASLNVADSKTALTKRQYGPLGNALATGWGSFLDSLGYESDDVVQNAGSASLGGIVPSFTIDNGYPAPAYPVPAYPGATYSGPPGTQVFPNVPNSGSYSAPLDV